MKISRPPFVQRLYRSSLISALWPVAASLLLASEASATVTTLGTPAYVSGADSIASYTVPAGANRLLVVTVSHADDAAQSYSIVTFNGQAMAKAGEKSDGTTAVDSIWYRVLGTGGSGTTGAISVTRPTSAGTRLTTFLSAQAFEGVDQSTPTSSAVSTNNPNLNNVGSTLSVTSASGDLVLDIFDLWHSSSMTRTVAGGQTISTTTGTISLSGLASYGGYSNYTVSTKPGASPNVSMSWTSTGSAMIQLAVNLKQATAAAPTVTTATEASVVTTSATLGGNVTADGGASVTDRGIVWATTATPTTANNKVSIGTGTGAFSQSVTGLPAGTAIYVRAFAINSAGTSYGSQINFTTSTADTTPPTVASVVRKTPSTQNLANNTATVTFTVTYSEAVTGVAAARFAIENVNGGTVAGTVGTPVIVSTSVYDVPVTITSGSGEFRLKVID